MSKDEFLKRLGAGLSGLPREDINERLGFYAEMIDDRIEEGMTEEEAVAAVGSVEEVTAQILTETPLSKIVKEKIKPKRALRAWEILLLTLGFPLWFPLLAAAFFIVLALYISIWAVIISFWVAEVSLWACVPGGIFSAIVFTATGHGLSAAAMISAALCCAGISIFWFYAVKAITKGVFRLTGRAALRIKSSFIKGAAA